MVLDSLGIGALPDAADFGDAGADTFGHIAQWCARPLSVGGRGRPLAIPNLLAAGLGHAYQLIHGVAPAGLLLERAPAACWGVACERSKGKDTVSGHWEMTGVPVLFDWGYFSDPVESFPPQLLTDLAREAGVTGFLGRCHASGTEIIERLGAEHLATGWPIAYTSADSVLQIAAHEGFFGLERLYALCRTARRLVDSYGIGRVIARPFTGGDGVPFTRTHHRKDYAVPPTEATLLDRMVAAGGQVIGIGKIYDIFAGHGISVARKANGLEALVATTLDAFATAPERSIVYTNLVDFDQEFGHRRDVAGYADAIERFDRMLPGLIAALGANDLLLLTADHGNDPTWRGSDHTREYVPVLALGPRVQPGCMGLRSSFADQAQTLAHFFDLPALPAGVAIDLQVTHGNAA